MKRKAKRVAQNASNSSVIYAIESPAVNSGYGISVPPSLNDVEIYFSQKGMVDVAVGFYSEYDSRQWKSETGQPVKNWKVCAAEWIYNYRQEMKRRFRRSPFYGQSL